MGLTVNGTYTAYLIAHTVFPTVELRELLLCLDCGASHHYGTVISHGLINKRFKISKTFIVVCLSLLMIVVKLKRR